MTPRLLRHRTLFLSLVFSFLTVVILPTAALATWPPNGCRIGAPAMATPGIVHDGAGGVYIVWKSYNGTTPTDVSVQRLDAAGNVLWGSEGLIFADSANSQYPPMAVEDGAGGVIAVWQDMKNTPHDQLRAQRIDADGNLLWGVSHVSLHSDTLFRYYPYAISDGEGGVIVVSEAYTAESHKNIVAQRIDTSGNLLWGPDGVFACSATNRQEYPVAASDGAGGAIIAWQDFRNAAVSGYDIYAQRIDASGTPLWTADGIAVITHNYFQEVPAIASDGAGGAILAWEDHQFNTYSATYKDIVVNRLDASGNVLWGSLGVGLTNTSWNDEKSAKVIPDGAGGAYVVWNGQEVNYGTERDIFVRRVDASGTPLWNAVNITPQPTLQEGSVAASDGEGGVIVTWKDNRGTSVDIYTQRVDPAGTVHWAQYGTPTCANTSGQNSPAVVGIGDGNAIVVWDDDRSSMGVYAQRVEGEHGGHGFAAASLAGVADVPEDEGGLVRLQILGSDHDDGAENLYPVFSYSVWQRVDGPLSTSFNEGSHPALDYPVPDGWDLAVSGDRTFLRAAAGLPAGTWELVGSFNAIQKEQYLYRVSTVVDSSAAGTPWAVYIVTTHATTPTIWWVSDPDSGYSVDNLAPAAPQGLAGEQSYDPAGLQLAWEDNSEGDLSGYAVYRGTSSDFVPSALNRIGAPGTPSFFDAEWTWNAGYWYKITALDVHGNESPCASLDPGLLTGDQTPTAPATNYLMQNSPNPFNPSTTIRFGLLSEGRVAVKIYDVSGRLVRVLTDGTRPAGHHEIGWDGRDNAGHHVSSGVFFYQLRAGTFAQTKKMIVLR